MKKIQKTLPLPRKIKWDTEKSNDIIYLMKNEFINNNMSVLNGKTLNINCKDEIHVGNFFKISYENWYNF